MLSRGKYENVSLLKNSDKNSSSEDCSIETEISSRLVTKAKIRDDDGTSDDEQHNVHLLSSHKKPSGFKESLLAAKFLQQKPMVNYVDLQSTERFADECEYRMNHANRGHAIIINNKKFHHCLDMPVRTGTDKDAACLQQTFTKLGFNVKLEHNKSAHDMRDILTRYAKMDHSQNDAFVCCILSHGEDGIIYGTDQSVDIEHLIQPFKFNRSLAGKPKLFFIQACRGTKLMDGIDTNPYKIQYVSKVPLEADFLFAYSTVSGYYSWRNSLNGSWFIQSLCDVLNLNGTSLEVMQLLTHVNRKVAYFYESNANDPAMSGKKQVPCVVSMLTKELYFKTKGQKQSDV
jgi:hypothetical protein